MVMPFASMVVIVINAIFPSRVVRDEISRYINDLLAGPMLGLEPASGSRRQ